MRDASAQLPAVSRTGKPSVIPAQAGIQSWRVAPDMAFGVKACFFAGQRLTQSLVLTESFLFALKASHFSLFAQRKGHRDTARAKRVGAGAGAWRRNGLSESRWLCDGSRTHAARHRGPAAKRNGTPTFAPAAPVPGLGEVLGARADTTSCRDGTFADVLSAQPLRATPSPALHEGDKGASWKYVNETRPRFCLSPLVRCRPKDRAQGIARQGCRASAVTTGGRVGAYPEHGPSGGDRRSAPAPRRGVISFGGGSTVPRSVGAGPVAQPPRLTEAIPPPCPRSRPDALRARRVAVAFSLGKQRKVTRRQGEKIALREQRRSCNLTRPKHLSLTALSTA
jgi:hypothetical protein